MATDPFNAIFPRPDFTKIPNDKGELPIKEEIKNDKGEVVAETLQLPRWQKRRSLVSLVR